MSFFSFLKNKIMKKKSDCNSGTQATTSNFTSSTDSSYVSVPGFDSDPGSGSGSGAGAGAGASASANASSNLNSNSNFSAAGGYSANNRGVFTSQETTFISFCDNNQPIQNQDVDGYNYLNDIGIIQNNPTPTAPINIMQNNEPEEDSQFLPHSFHESPPYFLTDKFFGVTDNNSEFEPDPESTGVSDESTELIFLLEMEDDDISLSSSDESTLDFGDLRIL